MYSTQDEGKMWGGLTLVQSVWLVHEPGQLMLAAGSGTAAWPFSLTQLSLVLVMPMSPPGSQADPGSHAA